MDSADRNRRRLWKDEQRAVASAAFPLSSEVLEEFFDAVDSALEQNGCDHTLRYTEQWLAAHVSDSRPTLTWLRSNGGYCDCEVIANACDHWEQTR